MELNESTLKEFGQKMHALGQAAKKQISREDFSHLQKIIWVNRLLLILGFATAWIYPNPFSMIAIGLALSGMWTMVAHPILHGGYDSIKGIPQRFHSTYFAKGVRRLLDWPDWMHPSAWQYEHNILHHFYTNEVLDPDQIIFCIQNKTSLFCKTNSKFLNRLLILITTVLWKPLYYTYTTFKALLEKKMYDYKSVEPSYHRQVIQYCFIPYVLQHFVLIPLPFLLISPTAYLFVLINRLGAEIITNIHSFLIIVPSHTASDLFIRNTHYRTKEAFYLDQIKSTCNYKTGGFWNDYFQGYMNYQIEHHLFPQLPLSQYPKLQPLVKSLCEQYQIPYYQESVLKRSKKLFEIMLQDSAMRI